MPARLAPFLSGVTVLIGLTVVAGCSSSSGGRAAGPTTAATTVPATVPATQAAPPTSATTTTAAATPPSTAYTPALPQSSPDAAAAALVADWASGSRAAAGRVAAPAAVASVFAQPYPYSYIQSRGCTDPSTNPGTCTYANRQSGSLYQIAVTRSGGGWYVSAVTVES